jgi:hypothetical protein
MGDATPRAVFPQDEDLHTDKPKGRTDDHPSANGMKLSATAFQITAEQHDVDGSSKETHRDAKRVAPLAGDHLITTTAAVAAGKSSIHQGCDAEIQRKPKRAE